MERYHSFKNLIVGHVKELRNSFTKIKTNELQTPEMGSRLGKGKRLTDRMIDHYNVLEMQSDKIKHACQICEKLFGLYISKYVQATSTIAQFLSRRFSWCKYQNQVVEGQCGNC
ncbi:hypothetical protein TNCV_931931 [Trichonephila clavipes]|nr:hypothetical protein TNCV_931931 [Trichonephila clavipes]